MHRNVETLIGRLATDSRLRSRFSDSPASFLRELTEHGLELNDVELEALASLDLEALGLFAGSLDSRLQKAPLPARHRDAGLQPQPVNSHDKENDQ